MGQERVFDVLTGLGLSEKDAQIYVFLAKKGPLIGRELSRALNLGKPQIYYSLKELQDKGLVQFTSERSARYRAISFEKVLELFVKSKLEEAKNFQKEKTNYTQSRARQT